MGAITLPTLVRLFERPNAPPISHGLTDFESRLDAVVFWTATAMPSGVSDTNTSATLGVKPHSMQRHRRNGEAHDHDGMPSAKRLVRGPMSTS